MRRLELIFVDDSQGAGIRGIIRVVIAVIKIIINEDPRVVVVT
jgi:hypothetical protein